MFRTIAAIAAASVLVAIVSLAQQPKTEPPASQPEKAAQPRRPQLPGQAQIYEQLLRGTERVRPPIMSVDPDNPQGPPAETKDASGLIIEGTILFERRGRLVRSGENTAFRFPVGELGENTSPVTLEFNKNGLLEAMEREAEAGVPEFVVTVEVTRYHGRNYLNLLKYRARIDHGNLSP